MFSTFVLLFQHLEGRQWPDTSLDRQFSSPTLRLGLSPLKKHKYNHKFSDTPSCACDCGADSEDTEHFLLRCPLFSTQRESLLQRVSDTLAENEINVPNTQIRVRTCLYGHSELNDNANKIILKATINFILESNRFS